MRPTFLIVGAAKCGTTSLFELLSAHPEIGMSTIKEPNFFSRDPVFQRGWEWYESLFAGQEVKLAVGEASHTYTKIGIYPHAVARIAEHLPEARLLYIVRHPLVRMESGWAQQVYGRVTRLRQDFNTSLRTVPSIVESSLYWKQISAYRTHYSDERIHTLFLEDLKRDPHGELARCFAFLGVNPDFRVPGAERPRNARAGRTIDEPLGDSLWFSVLRRLAPRSVKSAIRYEIPPAVWDEDTRRWAIERVVDDSLQFLRFYGKPPDFWDFRPVPTGTRLPPEIEVGSS